jgi:GrpB-like predicted nucleotidyltransferase (UPF0157 family)
MSGSSTHPILPYPKQPVTCAPYDPRAPEVAATLADLITALLPTATVEHFGSTAVPGCAGKGVIDLMILYHDLPIETVVDQLDRLGFQWVQRLAQLPDEWPKGMGAVSHMGSVFRLHIHVLPREHPMVLTNRAFRDLLRSDPTLVSAYVARKQTLVAMGTTEPIAYTQAKMPFIRNAMEAG